MRASKKPLRARSGSAVSLLACVVILLSPRPGQAEFGGGTGQSDDPFLISTSEHILAIGADPNLWDKHFRLMGDVDLADATYESSNMIGTADVPFSGVFDGGGHKVANIRINLTTSGNHIGMFGRVMGKKALIENLRLVNPHVEAPAGENVGALAGRLTRGTITNCRVEAGKISGEAYVGGLVGLNDAFRESSSPLQLTSIVNCSSDADVIGEVFVGGLVGYMQPGAAVTDCHTRGDVAGTDSSGYIGGLAGGNNYGSIIRCSSGASVSAGSRCQYLGGLVGDQMNGEIDNCYATGSVSAGEGGKWIGGLVGHVMGSITCCYSTGSVSAGPGSRYVGGLIGRIDMYGTLISCYANGLVEAGEGTTNIGGLIGSSTGRRFGDGMYGLVLNCFWDVQTSRMHTSAAGRGLTTAQMVDAETYSLNGWGGDPNWVLDDGKDYPHLAWEKQKGQVIPDLRITMLNGRGTREHPYLITNAQQLAFVGNSSILWDKCFVLVSDLDLTGISIPRIGVFEGTRFTGSFDGNGHSIRNMGLQRQDTTGPAHGLFGYIGSEGRVTNLSFHNAEIRNENDVRHVGILAHVNDGNITNCHAHGLVVAGGRALTLGGLVGENGGTLDSCSSATVVAGGDNSYRIDGLVGYNLATLTACKTTSTVSAGNNSRWLGGLIGSNYGSIRNSISNSYSEGSVTGGDKCSGLGGLVGRNTGKIVNSYSAVNISTASESAELGGLVGDNVAIVGGEITNCYFLNTPRESGPDNGVGSPLTNDQIQHKSSFQGWDFGEIWMIYEGKDRPHLKWEQDQGKV